MSKNMTWHIWKVTSLCRNVTIVCGASYHLFGSWISQDSKIRFWLQVKSYISDWQFSKSRHLARYVSRHNAVAYDRERGITQEGPFFFVPDLHTRIGRFSIVQNLIGSGSKLYNCKKMYNWKINCTTAKKIVQLQNKWHNCKIVRRNHTRN